MDATGLAMVDFLPRMQHWGKIGSRLEKNPYLRIGTGNRVAGRVRLRFKLSTLFFPFETGSNLFPSQAFRFEKCEPLGRSSSLFPTGVDILIMFALIPRLFPLL